MLLRVHSSLYALAPPFKLTNEAAERDEEEDMSTVKWLSGYVNAGRRQEHSEDSALRDLEKKYASLFKINLHRPSDMIFQYVPSVKGIAPLTSAQLSQINTTQLAQMKKKNTYMFILQEGHISLYKL